ncbi:MAG: aspartate kinase [Chitinispirillaceae bacterium]|nr:aspartate kinase [Chitinispirillaceae bacterium]
MEIVVCKFGGSSVATNEELEQIVAIIRKDTRRRCIVLSAPGKASGHTVKITDLLIDASKKALANQPFAPVVDMIKNRFHSIYEPLNLSADAIDTVLSDLDARFSTPRDHTEKFRDCIVSAGEDLNCRLFALYLASLGFSCRYVNPKEAGMLVTPVYGDAQPLPDCALGMAGLKQICAETIVIFPGFFGYTTDGDIATFSRGGSDLTGSLLAEALDASEYENWTDVNGIFSAHPGIVDNPEQIPALTYKEMRELSYMGFNVLHEEAVKPVMRKKIPIRLRNTNNILNTGTLIVSERLPSERDVIGVASNGGFCSFTLQKFLMNREKGFGRRLLEIFEELGLSYEHCPSGVDNISVILDQDQLKSEVVNSIIRSIEEQLQPDEIKSEFGISLVSVVGEGLVHKIGFLTKAATALSNAQVNIKMVNQGSSEMSIIFGIDASDEKKAVRALYDAFFS